MGQDFEKGLAVPCGVNRILLGVFSWWIGSSVGSKTALLICLVIWWGWLQGEAQQGLSTRMTLWGFSSMAAWGVRLLTRASVSVNKAESAWPFVTQFWKSHNITSLYSFGQSSRKPTHTQRKGHRPHVLRGEVSKNLGPSSKTATPSNPWNTSRNGRDQYLTTGYHRECKLKQMLSFFLGVCMEGYIWSKSCISLFTGYSEIQNQLSKILLHNLAIIQLLIFRLLTTGIVFQCHLLCKACKCCIHCQLHDNIL